MIVLGNAMYRSLNVAADFSCFAGIADLVGDKRGHKNERLRVINTKIA